MTLTSIGVVINKREFRRYLSGESYKNSYSNSLMFSNNKAKEQVNFCERNRELFQNDFHSRHLVTI